MPTLRLTPAQAARLWTLDQPICDAVLQALAKSGLLVRNPDGSYGRADEPLAEPW